MQKNVWYTWEKKDEKWKQQMKQNILRLLNVYKNNLNKFLTLNIFLWFSKLISWENLFDSGEDSICIIKDLYINWNENKIPGSK